LAILPNVVLLQLTVIFDNDFQTLDLVTMLELVLLNAEPGYKNYALF